MAWPNIGQCVSSGMEIFKKNALTYVIAWLVPAVLNGLTFGILIGP